MTFGDPKMSSGSPPESPSGTRGRPVLPPRRKIANRLRGSTSSGSQLDCWVVSAPQPPISLLQLCKDTVPLTGLPCLPARRTRGVGGLLGWGLGAGGWGWGWGAGAGALGLASSCPVCTGYAPWPKLAVGAAAKKSQCASTKAVSGIPNFRLYRV